MEFGNEKVKIGILDEKISRIDYVDLVMDDEGRSTVIEGANRERKEQNGKRKGDGNLVGNNSKEMMTQMSWH